MQIIVTGGAGFIGSNIVRALADVRQVNELVTVDDLSSHDAGATGTLTGESLEVCRDA